LNSNLNRHVKLGRDMQLHNFSF